MIEYRNADLNDISELVRLRIVFLQEMGNKAISIEDENLRKVLYEYFEERVLKNEFVAYLALENNEIIATSGLCFYTLPPSYKNLTGKVAYIMNMYTSPSYRKRGIAKVLFQKIVEEAKIRGYKYISLHATEKGRPLYLKFGFKDLNTEMTLKIE